MTMTDPIPPSGELSDHDYEIEELVRKLLPPVILQPYDDEGGFVEDAQEAVRHGVETAIRYKNEVMTDYADMGISDEVITHAVIVNFDARFRGAKAALDEYFESNPHLSKASQRVYGLHDLVTPEQALIFFLEQTDLPAIDVAAAICTEDSRNITSEIIQRTKSHFRNAEEVFDGIPELIIDDSDDSASSQYVVFSVEKEIFKVNGVSMKRRKTYISPIEWIDQIKENFIEIFSGNRYTPSEIYPVIESIYAVRDIQKRTSRQQDALDAALDDIDSE